MSNNIRNTFECDSCGATISLGSYNEYPYDWSSVRLVTDKGHTINGEFDICDVCNASHIYGNHTVKEKIVKLFKKLFVKEKEV